MNHPVDRVDRVVMRRGAAGFEAAALIDRNGALKQWREVLANAPADASWRPIVEDDLATVEGQQRP